MKAIGAILAFLAEHSDIVELVVDAIEKGVSKDSIRAALKKAMIEASDAQMREELGGDSK